jgi:hypothetical protein
MTKAERNDVLRGLVTDTAARQRGELCAVLAVATAERLGADDSVLERIGWAGRLAGALGVEGARRVAAGHDWLTGALADPLPAVLLASLARVWPGMDATDDPEVLAALAEVEQLVQPVGEQ